MVNYVFQIKPSQYARSLDARNTINANNQPINPGLFPVALAHRHGYLGNMLPLRPRESKHPRQRHYGNPHGPDQT